MADTPKLLVIKKMEQKMSLDMAKYSHIKH